MINTPRLRYHILSTRCSDQLSDAILEFGTTNPITNTEFITQYKNNEHFGYFNVINSFTLTYFR